MFTSGYCIFKPNLADRSDMEWATALPGAKVRTVASFKAKGQQRTEASKNIHAVGK